MKNLSLENQQGIRELRQISRQGREIRARALGRLEERRFDDGVDERSIGAPVEALGCPSCRQSYDFGDVCPSCDVLLVSYSLLDSEPPQKSPSSAGWLRRLLSRAS